MAAFLFVVFALANIYFGYDMVKDPQEHTSLGIAAILVGLSLIAVAVLASAGGA